MTQRESVRDKYVLHRIVLIMLGTLFLICLLTGYYIYAGFVSVSLGILNLILGIPFSSYFLLIGVITILYSRSSFVLMVIFSLALLAVVIFDAIEIRQLLKDNKISGKKFNNRDFLASMMEKDFMVFILRRVRIRK
jgi:hypothetical protein